MTLTLFSHPRVRFGEHPSLSRIYQTLLQVVHFSRANDEIIGNKTLFDEIGTSKAEVTEARRSEKILIDGWSTFEGFRQKLHRRV